MWAQVKIIKGSEIAIPGYERGLCIKICKVNICGFSLAIKGKTGVLVNFNIIVQLALVY